jgi:hypothetical protein
MPLLLLLRLICTPWSSWPLLLHGCTPCDLSQERLGRTRLVTQPLSWGIRHTTSTKGTKLHSPGLAKSEWISAVGRVICAIQQVFWGLPPRPGLDQLENPMIPSPRMMAVAVTVGIKFFAARNLLPPPHPFALPTKLVIYTQTPAFRTQNSSSSTTAADQPRVSANQGNHKAC